MLKLARIKTLLIKLLGPRLTGIIHGFRFAYLIIKKHKTDPEMTYLDSLIQNGDVCVDVGANSADWTNYFSRRIGNIGRVFSFEADPYYAHATHIACRVLRLDNVEFFAFGLSDKAEIVRLTVADKSGVLLSGTQKIEHGREHTGSSGAVSISLCRLDALKDEHLALRKTKFIKIDVEGYELFVLRGAEDIIRSARPVIVLEYGEYDDHGYTAADLNSYLLGLGYAGFAITHEKTLESVDDSMECPNAISANRIYLPQESCEKPQV